MEVDSGFDRCRHCGSRSGGEAVTPSRIQRPNVARFVEGDELVFPAQFAPQLQIHESILVPPIGPGVLTKCFLVSGVDPRGLLTIERATAENQRTYE